MRQLRSLGIFLIIIGIGSFILPLIGFQFSLISVFGKGSEALVGIVAIVLGVLLVGFTFVRGRR